MSLTPYFFNRSFGPSSYMDPFSSSGPFDDLFSPFALTTAPSSFGGLTTGGGLGGGGQSFQSPIHDLESMSLSPVMDVRDQGDKYQVVCKPPPNYNQNDLHIRIDRDILSINGQHLETEESGITSKRQSRRSFIRRIRLPDTIDQQQIIARWTNDGLFINLPKKAGALESGRKITIEGIERGSERGELGGDSGGGGGGGGRETESLASSSSSSSSAFSSTTTPSSSGDFRTVGGIGGGSASPMQKESAMQSSAIEAEPNK